MERAMEAAGACSALAPLIRQLLLDFDHRG